MINQVALCKLITVGARNIVNIKEDGFQYCNGCMMAECDYSNNKVLSKLFRVGAIQAGEKLKASLTTDLTKILQEPGEAPARRTKYMIQTDKYDKSIAVIFEVNNHYYAYNKAYIDVFEGATYAIVTDGARAMLKVYQGEKLIGIVLNIKTEKTLREEIQQIEL